MKHAIKKDRKHATITYQPRFDLILIRKLHENNVISFIVNSLLFLNGPTLSLGLYTEETKKIKIAET
jgi:hypothetical protein